MTSFRLQNLYIVDCESIIEKGFYNWGQVQRKKSSENPWDEATSEDRRISALRGYSLYEGLPVQRGNDLSAIEVHFSRGINSDVMLNDVVRFVSRADEARPLLEQIPDGVRLEEGTDAQIDAVAKLIELFSSEDHNHIARGKTTKVLYKKRPEFIPVIDSVVSHFLWTNFPHILSQSAPHAKVLRLYHDILATRAYDLQQIQSSVLAGGFYLSTARILSYLIWLGWRERAQKQESIRSVWKTDNLQEAKTKASNSWQSEVSTSSGD